MKVSVPLVTRVEGHGHVDIEMEGDEIKDVRFGIHEGPRYFEALMVGREWHEIPELAARICGICTVIHAVGAARAVENAANFDPPEILDNYRKLLVYSSHIQSHALHLYFLAWPDYIGKNSVFEALEYMDAIKMAFRIKGTSNELTELIGGRMVHPCTVMPGRLTKSFTLDDLKKYRKRMKDILEDLKKTVEIFSSLDYPDTTVDTEHLALYDGTTIPLIEGDVKGMSELRFSPEEYQSYIKEKVIPPNTTKRSFIDGRPFMVGALPRVNVNLKFLRDEVREFASQLPSKNVNLNNLAQALEVYHFGLEALDLVDEMISGKMEYVPPREKLTFPRNSEGVSIVEAPRGMLVHHYRINERGIVEMANVITPTAFNFEHIEQALRVHLPGFRGESDDKLKFESERVIRAYDPCISCSAHIVRTK